MFIDTAKINIKAGNGGNGSVSFHREKYVAAGGPDLSLIHISPAPTGPATGPDGTATA